MNLMPVPKEFLLKDGKFRLTNKFKIGIQQSSRFETDTILYKAINRFYQQLNRKTGLIFSQQYITSDDKPDSTTSMVIIVQSSGGHVGIGLDESYYLGIDRGIIGTSAPNNLGVLHSLQTLLQLLSKDDEGYYFPAIGIKDSPRFKWR